ncbi:MAG TPA: DUF222 domain-containing protein [Solirubrobacteraceae bacterium]|nr:DUF222 domain-containing protein [Solirubrobacteraceae bacterium]
MCSTAAKTVPLELLEREITDLACRIHAATCRWLELVAEYDRREGWAQWGCKSCAHWISHQCGIAPGAAREQVRVARRLQELPAVRAAFARGELSYSKARALTRVENVEREEDLLELARHATASQLERLVRGHRRVVATERATAGGRPERWVYVEHDDDGALLLQARLPAEEGALVLAALDAARDELAAADVSAETPLRRGPVARADALLALADGYLAGDRGSRTGGDRYQVVVHVDTATLSGQDGGARCEIDHGPPLAASVARRLACDAALVHVLEGDGVPLDVSRKTRSVPPALRRALAARDGGCRFPGCTSHRFVDAHHIEHWADGGRTKLGNLVLLCRHHHRLLHEGGYTLSSSGRRLTFRRPDGRRIHACPQPPRGRPGPLRPTRRPDACVPLSGDPLNLVDGVDAMLDFAPVASGEPPGV